MNKEQIIVDVKNLEQDYTEDKELDYEVSIDFAQLGLCIITITFTVVIVIVFINAVS